VEDGHAPPGVPSVSSESFNIGLDGLFAREKHETNSVAWDAADEPLRVLEHACNPPVEAGHIDGPLSRQHA